MLPGGRLRLSQNVTLKLITPSAPSLPQLSGAVYISKATPLPRLQDAISIKIVIPARGKRHAEPRQHPSVVDNPPPSIETWGSETETPQVSQVESNASNTARLHIIIPPLKARSFIAEDVDPGNMSSELPNLLYPSDREAHPIDPPLVPTVPLTPRESNVSTPVTSPLRAGFAPLPSVQGPFRMLRVLQEGGFATAWAAQDTSSGRLLCLKVFEKESPKHHRAEGDLLNELEVYKRIATSKEVCVGKMFIMELEMSFRTVDCICLAMDLMTNDLHHYMRTDSTYCHANARRWGAQLALGIHALHGMGIIHRDLKPENILIDARENVRIADFGLSYIDKKPLHPWGAYASDVMGTTQIMAPEIIYNKLNQSSLKYGLRVDWWSFGCVLYEIVSLEHKSLFTTAEDIANYVTRCYRDRRLVGSLPALNELDPCVGGLIAGLVRASEGIRYGFQEVRKHPWFVATNGVSEFDNACSRALRRIECPQLLHDLDDEGDEEPWFLVPLPARPCGRRCCPEVDWVNPRSGVVNNLPF